MFTKLRSIWPDGQDGQIHHFCLKCIIMDCTEVKAGLKCIIIIDNIEITIGFYCIIIIDNTGIKTCVSSVL